MLAVQSRLPGFVSAGVIQQNQDGDKPGNPKTAPPSMAANPEEMELNEEAEDEEAAQVSLSLLHSQIVSTHSESGHGSFEFLTNPDHVYRKGLQSTVF